MNIKKNNKPEDILNSLDGMKRAPVPDFFYTRLLAKMESGISENSKKIWILRPAYVVVTLLLIVAINVVVFLSNKDDTTVADDSQTLQQTIASEYSLADNNSIYDLNTDK
jgi:hypothetical protein